MKQLMLKNFLFCWVDDQLKAHDEFIGFKNMPNTDVDSIVRELQDVLLRMHFKLNKCRGHLSLDNDVIVIRRVFTVSYYFHSIMLKKLQITYLRCLIFIFFSRKRYTQKKILYETPYFICFLSYDSRLHIN